jgi:hypothetical protein
VAVIAEAVADPEIRTRLRLICREDTTMTASTRPLTAAWNAPSKSAAPRTSSDWI